MANKIKLKKDNKDTFCLAYNHVSDTQSVIALDKILIEGVQARAEDIQPKNKNSSVTYRVHDVKSQKLEVVSIIDIGNRPDLEEKLKKARGQGKRRKVPKLKNLTPLARPNLNDDEENEVSQQEEGIGTEEEQFLTDSDLSQFDKSNSVNTEDHNNTNLNSERFQKIDDSKIKNNQEVKNNNDSTVQVGFNAPKNNSLNTEEENNIHINSESRQQINGNKINNSQEVKNNNGNTVQLVPNAKKKNLKQIRIIQSLPIRTNEIELLELEQSLLKEERNKINNRYLHQAEIIRALRKKSKIVKIKLEFQKSRRTFSSISKT
ncbi:uncharacterized protein DDB_G0287625-like [Cotesia glomerata]|uniref:uncharacterized protein DDB_G0287625-like n=1 Tax=Cotesia glomerata TaxID=32391 RepID=UPI001D016014|nr:uncharacterized protein DDB_G0287625-like [Cotesia glomerata]